MHGVPTGRRDASASPPTASAATTRGGCSWPGPRPPHPAGPLVPPRRRGAPRREPDRLAAPGDRGGIGPRPSSVGPLLDVLSDVRTLPDGTSLHTVRHDLPGGRRGRAPCGPRSAAPPTPSGGSPPRRCGPCRWRTTSRSSWTGCCEPTPDGDRSTSAPRRDHRLRLRRPLRRPGPQAGAGADHAHRPHQPPPLPAPALPGGHRASSRRARSPRPSATSSATTRRCGSILGEVEDIDVEAREVHADEFGKPLTIALRQPDRGRRRGHLVLRARRVPRRLLRHEDPRRRPGAAGPHLRRLRAGRGRDGRRGAPAPHDLRRRRRRPDRRGDGRPADASSRGGRCGATTG